MCNSILFIEDKIRFYIKNFFIYFVIETVLYGLIVMLMEKLKERFVFAAWITCIVVLLLILIIYPNWIAPLFNKFENLSEEIEKEKLLKQKIEELCKKENVEIGLIDDKFEYKEEKSRATKFWKWFLDLVG